MAEHNEFYDRMFKFAMKWEGGLSDDADDHGGLTKYGVSLVFLKDFATSGFDREFLGRIGVRLPVNRESIKALSMEQSKEIFKRHMYMKPGFSEFDWRVTWCLYDAAMNCGIKQSVKFAQRGYNTAVGPYGVQLTVDGIIGPKTLRALRSETAGTDKAISAMLDARETFYRGIAKGSQAKFLRGWLNRTSDLRVQLWGGK